MVRKRKEYFKKYYAENRAKALENQKKFERLINTVDRLASTSLSEAVHKFTHYSILVNTH